MRRRLVTWGLVASLAACVDGAVDPEEGQALVVKQSRVESRDGRLGMNLPNDLLVHRHASAIMATSADGSFRFYISHQASDGLMRLVGETKEVWLARGWEITAEHHFDSAVELTAKRGQRHGARRRTAWLITPAVPEGGAPTAIVCEAFAPEEAAQRLTGDLKAQCRSVEYLP